MDIREEYSSRYTHILVPLAHELEKTIQGFIAGIPHVDRVSARAKSVERFLAKAEKVNKDGSKKYADPLNEIQDQIGARIITFYLSDVDSISTTINKYFRPIEQRLVIPESEREFGYVGKHFILFLPSELLPDDGHSNGISVFELQIKTLFQHAWSEAEHDLNYKPEMPLSPEQKRRIAFTAAQAWGADHHFDSLYRETIVEA